MTAEVVGKKQVDFTDDKGKHVKMTKFFVTIDTGETSEGVEVDLVTWNEIEKGDPPPELKVGAEIDVAYNKRGKLRYVEPKKAAWSPTG